MCYGSEDEQLAHQGECETTDDVRVLFERYRAEARHYAELMGDVPRVEPELDRPAEPVLSGR